MADDEALDLGGNGDVKVVITGCARDAIIAATAESPVVVILDTVDRRRTAEALAAGASGVLVLEDIEHTLTPALHAVARGLVVVSRATREAVRRPVLSAREKQILGLLVMGLTNAEIGRRLYLAESTVKYHLFSVYAKLGVRTRQEAADLVLDPSAGLGMGILALTDAPRSGGGYSEPGVG